MPGEFDSTSTAEGGIDMVAAASEIASGLGFGTDAPEDSPENLEPDAGSDDTSASAPAPASTDDSPADQEKKSAPPAPPPPGGAADLAQPPKTWRKEATAGWETLPEHVRAEIHKREQDMYAGLEQYRGSAKLGEDVNALFTPYRQVMESAGVTATDILPGLVNSHGILALGSDDAKVNMLESLVRDYGIPLPKLLAKLTGGAVTDVEPFVDPTVKDLQTKVEALHSRLSAEDQRAAQAKQAEIRASIEAFANDPANIYFSDLADDIAQLIRGGVTKDIKVAYEKALWANPVVRAKEQARLAAEAESERTRKAAEAAAKARRATAANVRTLERAGSPTAAKPTSIDETLEQTLAQIHARSN